MATNSYPPNNVVPLGLNGYYRTGSDGTPSTSYAVLSTPTQLVLPAGNWLIQAKGWWEYSTGTARVYNARIYNSTAAVELDANTGGPMGTGGRIPYSMGGMWALNATSTIRIERKVDVVDGTQLMYVSLWAVPLISIS